MKTTVRTLSGAAAAALIGLSALVLSSAGAQAGHSVATRCTWSGCSHIVCNHTGDRCHRFYGEGYYRPYRESYYRHRSSYDDGYGDGYGYRDGGYDRRDGWRYDCDRDADNCYVRRGDDFDAYDDDGDY